MSRQSERGHPTDRHDPDDVLLRIGLRCARRVRERPNDFREAASWLLSLPDGSGTYQDTPQHFGPVLHRLSAAKDDLIERYRAEPEHVLDLLTVAEAYRIILYAALVLVRDFDASIVGITWPWRVDGKGQTDGRGVMKRGSDALGLAKLASRCLLIAAHAARGVPDAVEQAPSGSKDPAGRGSIAEPVITVFSTAQKPPATVLELAALLRSVRLDWWFDFCELTNRPRPTDILWQDAEELQRREPFLAPLPPRPEDGRHRFAALVNWTESHIESAALKQLGGRDVWGVDELQMGMDVDLLRCLDDRELIEVRIVVMQNNAAYPGDSTPPSPSRGAWFSPLRNPSMAGEWEAILSERARTPWSHPNEIRVSERGRVELTRLRRGMTVMPTEVGTVVPSLDAAVDRGARTDDSKATKKPKLTRRERQVKWLAEAMLTVRDNPEWSDATIAERVGINKSRLSRSPEYQAAARMARSHKIPDGTVTIAEGDRTVEAIDESFDPNRAASRQSSEEEEIDDRIDREIIQRNTKRNAKRNDRR